MDAKRLYKSWQKVRNAIDGEFHAWMEEQERARRDAASAKIELKRPSRRLGTPRIRFDSPWVDAHRRRFQQHAKLAGLGVQWDGIIAKFVSARTQAAWGKYLQEQKEKVYVDTI